MQRTLIDWTAAAACRGLDVDQFFATDDHAARQVCRSCPVSGECAKYAIAARLSFGIWAGLDPMTGG